MIVSKLLGKYRFRRWTRIDDARSEDIESFSVSALLNMKAWLKTWWKCTKATD